MTNAKFKPGDEVIRTKPYLYKPDSMPVGSTWIVDSYEYEYEYEDDNILRLVGKTGGWTPGSYELVKGYLAPAPVKRVIYNGKKV